MAELCKVCHGAVAKSDRSCPHCGAAIVRENPIQRAGKPADVDDVLNSLLREKAEATSSSPSQPEKAPYHPQPEQGIRVADAPSSFAPLSGSSGRGTNDRVADAPSSFAPLSGPSGRGTNDRVADAPSSFAPLSGRVADAPPSSGTGSGDVPLRPVRRTPQNRRPEGRAGALESAAVSGARVPQGSRVSRVLIVLVVLAVVVLFTTIFLFYVLPAQEQNRQQQEILGYLGGAWISDEFAFMDSTSMNHVEVLQVNADGTYRMTYTVPDEENPAGWQTDAWEIEYEISGNLVYDAEAHQILLLYQEDGEGYAFSRVMVVQEEDRMVLREYYDETQSSFYDITLHRIDLGEAA